MRPGRREVLRVIAAALLLLGAVGCSGNADDGDGGCALAFVRDGETYYPYDAVEPVQQGRSLGAVSSAPCDDGSVEADATGSGETRPAFAIPGVDPALAFVVPRESLSTVFAPGQPDGRDLPAVVEELLDKGED